METITAIRNRRAEMNVPMSKKAKLFIDSHSAHGFRDSEKFYEKLAGASEVVFGKCKEDGAVEIITHAANLYIPFAELVNLDEERARLTKELDKAKSELARVKAQALQTKVFVSKAPAALIEAERGKLAKYETLVETITKSLENL